MPQMTLFLQVLHKSILAIYLRAFLLAHCYQRQGFTLALLFKYRRRHYKTIVKLLANTKAGAIQPFSGLLANTVAVCNFQPLVFSLFRLGQQQLIHKHIATTCTV